MDDKRGSSSASATIKTEEDKENVLDDDNKENATPASQLLKSPKDQLRSPSKSAASEPICSSTKSTNEIKSPATKIEKCKDDRHESVAEAFEPVTGSAYGSPKSKVAAEKRAIEKPVEILSISETRASRGADAEEKKVIEESKNIAEFDSSAVRRRIEEPVRVSAKGLPMSEERIKIKNEISKEQSSDVARVSAAGEGTSVDLDDVLANYAADAHVGVHIDDVYDSVQKRGHDDEHSSVQRGVHSSVRGNNVEASKVVPSLVPQTAVLDFDDSSDSDANKNLEEYIIVTSHATSGILPDLIMGARDPPKKPSRVKILGEVVSKGAGEVLLNKSAVEGRQKGNGGGRSNDEYSLSLEAALRKDDESIIHAKPTNPDLIVPPKGAIMRNPLKEGVKIAVPRREGGTPYYETSPRGCNQPSSQSSSKPIDKPINHGPVNPATSAVPINDGKQLSQSPYWLINIYTEHDKRIPCFTRPVNWIRVDVDVRFYDICNEEINARLFTLLNYPLFLPQIRLQPLSATKPPGLQPAYCQPIKSNVTGVPIISQQIQTTLLSLPFSGLLMRPILGTAVVPPSHAATPGMADLVPTRERYRRVWADMPDVFTIRSSPHSRDKFTLVLYILPDPAIASMLNKTESNMPPPLKGWRLMVMVVPPTKLGIQNICQHEYFVPAPTNQGQAKRSHDDYLVADLNGEENFHFHVLWEIKNRRKHYVSWSAVVEFSQTREEIQRDPTADISARLLISSVPFHFGGASNGSGSRHIIGHAFLPKPNQCDRPEFHAKPRFTHLHAISLPRPAAYASRFRLPVSVHAFCLPELTPDKERLIGMTPYNDYCKQMISYAKGLHQRRAYSSALPPTQLAMNAATGDRMMLHGDAINFPPAFPIAMSWGNPPWFRMCPVPPRFGLLPHFPSQYMQPQSGLRRIQQGDGYTTASCSSTTSSSDPAVDPELGQIRMTAPTTIAPLI